MSSTNNNTPENVPSYDSYLSESMKSDITEVLSKDIEQMVGDYYAQPTNEKEEEIIPDKRDDDIEPFPQPADDKEDELLPPQKEDDVQTQQQTTAPQKQDEQQPQAKKADKVTNEQQQADYAPDTRQSGSEIEGALMHKRQSTLAYWKSPEFTFEHFDRENRFRQDIAITRVGEWWDNVVGKRKNVTFVDKDNPKSKITYSERSINNLNFVPKIKITEATPNNIHEMLNLAEEQQWESVKLRGFNRKFKQEAWLQASLRGLDVSGYQPTKADLARLDNIKAQHLAAYEEYLQNPDNPHREALLHKPPYLTKVGIERLYEREMNPMKYNGDGTIERGDKPQQGMTSALMAGVIERGEAAEQSNSTKNKDAEKTQEDAKTEEAQQQQQTTQMQQQNNEQLHEQNMAFLDQMNEMSQTSQSPQPHLIEQMRQLPPDWIHQIQNNLQEIEQIRTELSQVQSEQGDLLPPIAQELDSAYQQTAFAHAQACVDIYDKQKSVGVVSQPPIITNEGKQTLKDHFADVHQKMLAANQQTEDHFQEEKYNEKASKSQEKDNGKELKEVLEVAQVAGKVL